MLIIEIRDSSITVLEENVCQVEIWYSNGNRKEVSGDGRLVKVYYYNGDMKETHSSGLVKYLYRYKRWCFKLEV